VFSRLSVIAPQWVEPAPVDTLPGARRTGRRPPPRRGIVEIGHPRSCPRCASRRRAPRAARLTARPGRCPPPRTMLAFGPAGPRQSEKSRSSSTRSQARATASTAPRDPETVSLLYRRPRHLTDLMIVPTTRAGSRTSSERARPPELTDNRLSKATAPHRRPPDAPTRLNSTARPRRTPGGSKDPPPTQNSRLGGRNSRKQPRTAAQSAKPAQTAPFFYILTDESH